MPFQDWDNNGSKDNFDRDVDYYVYHDESDIHNKNGYKNNTRKTLTWKDYIINILVGSVVLTVLGALGLLPFILIGLIIYYVFKSLYR